MAKYHFTTFGCQMNVRDSAWLQAALDDVGHESAEMQDADIFFLNTCSVREKPELRTREAIKRLAATRPDAAIVVMGCVATQLGEELFAIAPQVRIVAAPDNLGEIPDAIEAILQDPVRKIAALRFASDFPERSFHEEKCPTKVVHVNIMQGCDNFCAYCIVPFTRGRQKSRSRGAILAECESRLAGGARELCLLGQNVNAWGGRGAVADRKFASLLRDVAALPGLERLRFHTSHPADMGPNVVQCIAELPVVCPRIHLPLQSGSDRILKAMGRRHNRTDYLALVASIRAARPDVAFSTDLIVGFPGETDADFQDTLEMIHACQFISSYSFAYSDRPGTRAALMPDKIEPAEKLRRLKILQKNQDKLTAELLQKRTGQKTAVLLESPAARGGHHAWQGRDPYGVTVNVAMPADAPCMGALVAVQITEAKKHSLCADFLHFHP